MPIEPHQVFSPTQFSMEDDAEPQIGSPSKTDAHRASASKDVTGIVLLHEKRAITLTLAPGTLVHSHDSDVSRCGQRCISQQASGSVVCQPHHPWLPRSRVEGLVLR